METLKRISTNLIGITNDVLTVGAKVVVDSVRVVTEPHTCWPFHQGMCAFAMQPARLRAAAAAYPRSSYDWRPRPYGSAAGPELGALRGAAPIAAR